MSGDEPVPAETRGAATDAVVRGRDPLVMPHGLVTPLPWRDWMARSRSLQVGGRRVDHVEFNPFRYEMPALLDRPKGRPPMMLVVVLNGSSRGEVDGHRLSSTRGSAVLFDERASLAFQVDDRCGRSGCSSRRTCCSPRRSRDSRDRSRC